MFNFVELCRINLSESESTKLLRHVQYLYKKIIEIVKRVRWNIKRLELHWKNPQLNGSQGNLVSQCMHIASLSQEKNYEFGNISVTKLNFVTLIFQTHNFSKLVPSSTEQYICIYDVFGIHRMIFIKVRLLKQLSCCCHKVKGISILLHRY